ncbi:MAG: gfo/Idh/MocA family oxidoreductase, partial [Bacteroidetes bacterium]
MAICLISTLFPQLSSAQSSPPLRIGVAGLTHTHVHWIFNSARNGDIEIVGIAEPNKELAQRYAQQYGFPSDKIYATLAELIEA